MIINRFFFGIFICLSIINYTPLHAQDDKIQDSLFLLINTGTNDSLIMEWYNQLRRLNINENPEEALKYSKKYAEYAKKLGLDKKYAVAKAYEATSYIPMGLYDEALKSLFEAENYFDQINDTVSLSSVYNSFGAVYEKSGRDSMAYIYFSKCLELAKGKNDFRSIHKTAGNRHRNIHNDHSDWSNFDHDAANQSIPKNLTTNGIHQCQLHGCRCRNSGANGYDAY